MQRIVGILVLSVFFFSCSKNESSVILKETSDYYPLKVGAWYIYDVDSIWYNDFYTPVQIDTLTYQVKEELTDSFRDLEGDLSFELTRSKRAGNDSVIIDSVTWKVSNVWWVKETNDNIERTEENLKYVSMLNPIRENSSWDGNVFNYMDGWDYTYANVAQPFGEYPNTVTVNQKQEDVVIIYRDFNEVFAEGIGMVSRTRIDVESQAISTPGPILNKAQKGFQYLQVLVDYYIPAE